MYEKRLKRVDKMSLLQKASETPNTSTNTKQSSFSGEEENMGEKWVFEGQRDIGTIGNWGRRRKSIKSCPNMVMIKPK